MRTFLPSTASGAKRCDPADFHASLTEGDRIVHALNRLTFGARPADVAAFRRAGLKQWIDRQLHPEHIAEDPNLVSQLARPKRHA